MNLHKFLTAILFFYSFTVMAQENSWSHRRKVTGVEQEGWYSIQLPADIFKHTSPTFDDLRLFTIAKDTLEVPFVLNVSETQYESEAASLSVMNESRKSGVYYVTFLNSGKTINQIDLEFEEPNYFGSVKLEGSQNNKDWFQIIDEQKIFSVRNSFEQYRYNELHFPSSKYDYFRIAVTSQTALHFVRATFQNYAEKTGTFVSIENKWETKQEKQTKQTIINVKLSDYQPTNTITIGIPSQKDYYRSASVEVVIDSFKTEKGWMKNYQNVYNGYVSSIRPNEIVFPFALTNEVKIVINNLDNPPLSIDDMQIKGPVVEVTASLNTIETFLYYGKKNSLKPSYDIEHFREKIPTASPYAKLGIEETLIAPAEKVTAFFENKAILYGIMFAVIAVLGFFTLRMMKTKPQA